MRKPKSVRIKSLVTLSIISIIFILLLAIFTLNWVVNIVIILLFSIILAIPVVIITMDLSRKASWHLYGMITRLFHAHSPAIKMLDNNMVPFVDYGYQNSINIGKQRNPLTIAVKAIAYYEEFSKTGKINNKVYFF